MAYDLYLLPVPPGADPEEAGEALLARLDEAVEQAETPPSDPGSAALVVALRAADPALRLAPERTARAYGPNGATRPIPVTDLRDAVGIEVTVSRTFARFRIPFEHRGDDAGAVFDRLFRLLAAAEFATGWSAYDPQEAEGVPIGDIGREQTLEIYLSVMDQIAPGVASGGGAGRRDLGRG